MCDRLPCWGLCGRKRRKAATKPPQTAEAAARSEGDGYLGPPFRIGSSSVDSEAFLEAPLSPTSPKQAPPIDASSPVLRDWVALDASCEAFYAKAQASTEQLVAAMEAKDPGLSLRRTTSTQEFMGTLLASEPDAGYRGPRPGWPLSAADVTGLVRYFASDPAVPLYQGYVLRILLDCTEMFAAMPQVTRVASLSGQHKKLVVVGDLHGQLADLLVIFLQHGFPDPEGTQYIFNGDFVDRGPMGVEVVLTLLAYKLLYPDSVHLNRGNHESERINQDFGFFAEVTRKYPGIKMFRLFTLLWIQLPLVTVIDEQTVVLHGGLFSSKGITLDHLDRIPKKEVDYCAKSFSDKLLVQLLWSDPQAAKGRAAGTRAAGDILFGPDVTQEFLRTNRMRLLIRSHQVPSDNGGFEILHDGFCLTVFSASNYCGVQGNLGGVVVFDQPGTPLCTDFWAPELAELLPLLDRLHPPPDEVRQVSSVAGLSREISLRTIKDAVVVQLQTLLRRRGAELEGYFRGCEQDAEGGIARHDWRQGLQSVLGLEVDWETYEEDLLPSGSGLRVPWREFIALHQPVLPDLARSWLQSLQTDVCRRVEQAGFTLADYCDIFGDNSSGPPTMADLQGRLSASLCIDLTDQQAEHMLAAAMSPTKPLDLSHFEQAPDLQYTGPRTPPCLEAVAQSLLRRWVQEPASVLRELHCCDAEGHGSLTPPATEALLRWLVQWNPTLQVAEATSAVQELLDSLEDHSLSRFLSLFKPSPAGAAAQAEALVHALACALCGEKQLLQSLFLCLDVDDDGLIDMTEFQSALNTISVVGSQITVGELQLLVQHVPEDRHGQVNYQDFLHAFQPDEGSGRGNRFVLAV